MTVEQIKISQEQINEDLSNTVNHLSKVVNHLLGTSNEVETTNTIKILEPNGRLEEIECLQGDTYSIIYDLSVLCKRLVGGVYNSEDTSFTNIQKAY